MWKRLSGKNSKRRRSRRLFWPVNVFTLLMIIFFTESAHWANSVIELGCLSGVSMYLVPSPCDFSEASHWPSYHMISSRPLIGQPLHSYIPKFLHSCIPTFIHSYITTLLHSYIPIFLHSYIPTFHHSIIPSFHHSIIPSFHHSIIPSSII